MSRFIRFGFLAFALVAFAQLTPRPAFADERIETTEGQIHDLDFDDSMVLISGVTYYFAIDAKVEIGGTYGAPTMLSKGMNVRFTFRRYDDGKREIVELAELPDDVKPQLF